MVLSWKHIINPNLTTSACIYTIYWEYVCVCVFNRSLKLWMVLRLYGAEILKSYIRNHIKLAKVFEQLVSQDPNFEVITPRIFSLVCFRMVPIDDDEKKCNSRNLELLEAVNSSVKLFISHTVSTDFSFLLCWMILLL